MKMIVNCLVKILLPACILLAGPTSASPLFPGFNPLLRSTRLSNSLNANPSSEGSNLYDSDWVRISEAPPRMVQATVGERLELECEAIGNRPMIQWVRGDEQVTENESYESNLIPSREGSTSQGLSKIRSRLVVNSVLPPHQGPLTCVATSGAKSAAASTALIVLQGKDSLRGNFSALLAALPLSQPRARIVLWNSVIMATQGSDIVLPCKAIGNPTPQILWLDNNQQVVSEDEGRIKILPDGELHIQKLSWRDMGAYTCIARNSFSKDTSSTFIYPLLNEN